LVVAGGGPIMRPRRPAVNDSVGRRS